jgi:hypothetical protein
MEAIDNWRKSRHSGNGGNCVEVASRVGRVLVRDTKNNGHGPVLRFSPGAWQRFADRVKRSLPVQSQTSRRSHLGRRASRAKLPALYRAQILAYLIAVDECVTVFESAIGGEPGLVEDASRRCSDQSGAL